MSAKNVLPGIGLVVTLVAIGTDTAKALVARLVQESQWFQCEPFPHDHYYVTVKEECGPRAVEWLAAAQALHPDPNADVLAAHDAGEHVTSWAGCPTCEDVG